MSEQIPVDVLYWSKRMCVTKNVKNVAEVFVKEGPCAVSVSGEKEREQGCGAKNKPDLM